MSEPKRPNLIDRLRMPRVQDSITETYIEAADEIERLRERCKAYKGQVKAGADEIERWRDEASKKDAELTALRNELDKARMGWGAFEDLREYVASSASAGCATAQHLLDKHSLGGQP